MYLPDRPHTHDPQCQSGGIPRRDDAGYTPPGPRARTSLGIGCVPQHGQDQEEGHVGGGLGHGVDGVAEPHALAGHPLDVELVEAGTGGRDDPAVGDERLQQILVEWLVGWGAHADDEGVDRALRRDTGGEQSLRVGAVVRLQHGVIEFLLEFGQVLGEDVFGRAERDHPRFLRTFVYPRCHSRRGPFRVATRMSRSVNVSTIDNDSLPKGTGR